MNWHLAIWQVRHLSARSGQEITCEASAGVGLLVVLTTVK